VRLCVSVVLEFFQLLQFVFDSLSVLLLPMHPKIRGRVKQQVGSTVHRKTTTTRFQTVNLKRNLQRKRERDRVREIVIARLFLVGTSPDKYTTYQLN